MHHRTDVLFLLAVLAGCLYVGEAWAVSVPVPDFSFEDSVLTPGGVPYSPSYWRAPFSDGAGAGTYAPISPVYGNQDGDNLGFLFVNGDPGFAALFQDAARIEEGTYTLTVGVGHEPDAEPTSASFIINFESTGFGGGTVLMGENEFVVGTVDSSTLTDISASVEIEAGSPEIGRALRPVLLELGPDAGSNPLDPRAGYFMDNVRLDFTPVVGPTVSLPVGQPSFEPETWYNPFNGGANAGEYRPVSPVFPNQEGDQLGYITLREVGGFGALFQDATTIAGPGTYTLTVGVGHEPGFEPTSGPLNLNFEAISPDGNVTLLGETTFAVGSANSTTLTDLSASVTILDGQPDIGSLLRLVLVADGEDPGTSGGPDPRATYLFDNVRLDFVSSAAGLAGDYNDNGFIDAADYTAWRDALTAGATELTNDSTPGTVDESDFLYWRDHFGEALGSGGGSGSAASVPEPSSILLLMAGVLSCWFTACRRSC